MFGTRTRFLAYLEAETSLIHRPSWRWLFRIIRKNLTGGAAFYCSYLSFDTKTSFLRLQWQHLELPTIHLHLLSFPYDRGTGVEKRAKNVIAYVFFTIQLTSKQQNDLQTEHSIGKSCQFIPLWAHLLVFCLVAHWIR